MPQFEYSAIDERGKTIRGTIDAETARVARQKLRAKGVYATDIKEGLQAAKEKALDVKRFFTSDRVKITELAVATRQLATLVGAGLPLVESLQALSEQVESANLKRIIIEVRENVQEGSALAKAMGAFPKAFPRLYVNMVGSGEASGTLDAVLENLADYLESQQDLQRRVRSALMYPAFMLVFCMLVVIALLTYVVPTITDIFIKQKAILPLPTRILMGLSAFLKDWWLVLIAAGIGVVYGIKFWYKQDKGRNRIDRLLLRLPIYGSLTLKINTARVAKTLGTLLQNGVGLLEALEIVKTITANVHLSRAIEEAKDGVREGRSLARELARSNMFPPMVIHMIAIGEKSGKLESMLNKAGKAYESEVQASLSGLTTLIEPLMIIFLGLIVFSIVISVLLPMVDLMDIIQK